MRRPPPSPPGPPPPFHGAHFRAASVGPWLASSLFDNLSRNGYGSRWCSQHATSDVKASSRSRGPDEHRQHRRHSTDSTSTDSSTCGTRLMMMMARRGEGREIEEGKDGKGKGEREPETKRKGASAVIGRSIRPLPIHGYLIFCSYLCQASNFCLYCPNGHSSHCSRASAMERPRIRGVNWNAER